jgi:putative cardiolipin synthase
MLKPIRSASLLALLLLLQACALAAREMPPKPEDGAVACDATPLAELAQARGDLEGAENDIALLDTGRQAFLWRVALIEAATCSIDAQYYIWNSDDSGRYVAARLLAAADRGVRVRLLLDDMNVAGRDGALAALDQHPLVEIQIYNPAAERKGLARMFSFVREFSRMNRRMHNKSFTVDGKVTILGGRNIGDEYFDADPEMNFRDRDVAVIGPVAGQAAAMFDGFWNSRLARPVSELAPAPEGPAPAEAAWLVEAAAARMNYLHGPLPMGQGEGLGWVRAALAASVRAPARLIYDPPPALAAVGDTDTLQPSSQALRDLGQTAKSELLIESAYLVVDQETLAQVHVFHDRGVRIRALTNSLASNDVTANHAAYARTRVAMLEHGIELFEFRPDAQSCRRLVENHAPCAMPQMFGLHAKTFVMDRRFVYVGSLNMNLRSHYLNAESGLVIDSPELAARIAADIEENMQPGNSWKPVLDERGGLRWIEDHDAAEPRVIYRNEPREEWQRRLRSSIIAALPLEKYL